MRIARSSLAALTALGAVALPAVALAAPVQPDLGIVDPATARLDQRATLSADYIASPEPSGALATPANGRTTPFPGQVIPGFSGIVDRGDGTFWGLPDNGFGTKANSRDFLLRLYDITPNWETASGGLGTIAVNGFIQLNDANDVLTFPIVNEGQPGRLLTGGDFDIESVQQVSDGTLWIGEEFGPFLLHVAADGTVLGLVEPPFGKSPQNPFLGAGETPVVRPSRGFEALAQSPDGTTLYPIVEGYFAGQTGADQLRRAIYAFDVGTGAYTSSSWQYRTDAPENVIGDAVGLEGNRILLIERDDAQGPAAVFKRLYLIDLDEVDAEGFVAKRLVVDLLDIDNPALIGDGAPAGGYGLGDPFRFPLQSVETLAVLADGRILVGNDNNYPGSNGRVPGTPDDTELIVISFASGPGPVIPEAPFAALLPVAALAVLGGALVIVRRSRPAAA